MYQARNKFLLGVIILALIGVGAYSIANKSIGIAGSRTEHVDIIGTVSSPSTLTASFNGNSSTIAFSDFDKIGYQIDYRPTSLNSYVEVLVQLSTDGGVTYRPWGATQINTSSIAIYNGPSSTFQGVPLVYPGELTSVSGTLYRSSEFQRDLIATHIRTLVREVTSSTFGTIYVAGALSTKR